MNRLVVDASVLIKIFIHEEGSKAATTAVSKADALLAPDLLWAEVGHILWKYVRRDELSDADANALLVDMLRMPIEILSSRDLVETALELAISRDRTVYDSFYLAAALQSKAVMVTADKRLVNALASTPLAKHVRLLGLRSINRA